MLASTIEPQICNYLIIYTPFLPHRQVATRARQVDTTQRHNTHNKGGFTPPLLWYIAKYFIASTKLLPIFIFRLFDLNYIIIEVVYKKLAFDTI